MGVDCSIYSLDPATGEIKDHGLDRHWVFDTYPTRRAICERPVPTKEALVELASIREYQHGPHGEDESHRDSGYSDHWINEAQAFICQSPETFLFQILSENDPNEPEEILNKYAEGLIRSQWPRCPKCEYPPGISKKADRLREESPSVFRASCGHQGVGEKTCFAWHPKDIPKWVLDMGLPLYGEKFGEV